MFSGELEDDLRWLLLQMKFGLTVAEDRAVRQHGMDLWGYTVLLGLAEEPARTQLALAEASAIDKSKMVAVLDDLETAGLITRRPDPKDRRARIVTATDAGKAALAAARDEVAAIERIALDGLDAAQRAAFKAALRRAVHGPLRKLASGEWPPEGPGPTPWGGAAPPGPQR
ncbi:MarR family winged helix-turn-helix transcriptional regulator [Streptomyces carpaticus]|uniref:MarR family winged helix-turn-helix transcriptional regulator n=2 Tax=Streptomyces TaxID=1883 RepID=A0ABV4ZGG1_9ACTN